MQVVQSDSALFLKTITSDTFPIDEYLRTLHGCFNQARTNPNVTSSDDKLAATPTTHFSLQIAHGVHAPEILFRQLLQLGDLEAAHFADAAYAGDAWCQDGDAGCGAYGYNEC